MSTEKECTKDLLRSMLKEAGLKCTDQRVLVLLVLQEKEHAVTAEEIYLFLSERDARISLSTVYRVLEVLILKGLVEKHGMPEGKGTYYELCRKGKPEQHSHSIICKSCRKSVKMEECPVDLIAAKLLDKEGFEITEHSIQIYGTCRSCRKKSKEKMGKG